MSNRAPWLVGHTRLSIQNLVEVARHDQRVDLAPVACERIQASRAVVNAVLAAGTQAPLVYGVNTGFGALAEVRISPAQIAALQRNLVRSHAAGTGASAPRDVVRAMMLLRAQVLAAGYSGARPVVCEKLCELLNAGVHPQIPSQGSVGASGDLAPLAHLALVLIGEGQAEYQDTQMPGGEALQRAGVAPLKLEAKEGLTLLNGTQYMTAVGSLAIADAKRLCLLADIAGAMSLEALQGTVAAFDSRIVGARPHRGTLGVAGTLQRLLSDSEIAESHRDCGKVQDPYSLRCMPQVHGASRDVVTSASETLETEANSCTDNPLVFVDGAAPYGGDIVSGGNFHGQPVAIALDSAAIAVAELADISERRIEQLVNPALSSGLPPFLTPDSGLNSGFMIAQVTAASLVNENKVYCHPASCDSIPSSAGREDHVSMGAFAANKLQKIVDNVRTVLAIELLCGAQGVDLRAPLRPGRRLRRVHQALRAAVPRLTKDRPIHRDIELIMPLLHNDTLIEAAGLVGSFR